MEINALFDEIAPTYDCLNHLFSCYLDQRWRTKAIQALAIPPQAAILDLCTGTGDLAIALAQRQRESYIYGIDLSEKMLQIGQAKIATKQLTTRIRLIQADALKLPFSEGMFDILTMSFGLRNLSDREQGLREMKRVLNTNGQALLLEFVRPPDSLLGKLYRLYLSMLIPWFGGIVSGSTGAYQYLHASIEQFLTPPEVVALLQCAGFPVVSCQRLMWGILYRYIARREDLSSPRHQTVSFHALHGAEFMNLETELFQS